MPRFGPDTVASIAGDVQWRPGGSDELRASMKAQADEIAELRARVEAFTAAVK